MKTVILNGKFFFKTSDTAARKYFSKEFTYSFVYLSL